MIVGVNAIEKYRQEHSDYMKEKTSEWKGRKVNCEICQKETRDSLYRHKCWLMEKETY
jgi:hypothetical protein